MQAGAKTDSDPARRRPSAEHRDASKERVFVARELNANERVLYSRSSVQEIKSVEYAKRIDHFEPHVSVPRAELEQATPRFLSSSQVKIISNPASFRLNKKVKSTAFTWQNNIYLSAEFQDKSAGEQEYLVEHEKAHIRQNKRVDNSDVIQRGWFSDIADYALKKAMDLVIDPIRKKDTYRLLMGLVGKDFFTGETVKVEPKEYIRLAFSFIPGGAEYFEALDQSGIFQKFFSWFSGRVQELGINWSMVEDLMVRVLEIPFLSQSVGKSISDFWEIVNVPVRKVLTFLGDVGYKLIELILDAFLLSPAGKWLRAFLDKAKVVATALIQRPVQFIKNVFEGIKRGFTQFLQNILKHLLGGVIDWLLGGLTEDGHQLQKPLSLSSILLFAIGVIGVSYENFRKILVAEIAKKEKDKDGAEDRAERKMQMLEENFDLIQAYRDKGIVGVWEKLKEKLVEMLTDVVDAIVSEVSEYLVVKVVTLAVEKVLGLLFPVTAILSAIKTVVDVLFALIDQIHNALKIIEGIFAAIIEIAAGAVGAAANFIERTFAKFIPIAIAFLAGFIGLGGLPRKIKSILLKVKKVVDKGMGKLAQFVAKLGGPVLEAAYKVAEKVQEGVAKVKGFVGSLLYKEDFTVGSEKHSFELMGNDKDAVLIISSEPTRFTELVEKVEVQVNGSDKERKAEILKILEDLKQRGAAIEKKAIQRKPKESARKSKDGKTTKAAAKVFKNPAIGELIAILRTKAVELDFDDLINGEVAEKLEEMGKASGVEFLRHTDKILKIVAQIEKLHEDVRKGFEVGDYRKKAEEIIAEKLEQYVPAKKDGKKTASAHARSKEMRARDLIDKLIIAMAEKGLKHDGSSWEIHEAGLAHIEGAVNTYAVNRTANSSHNAKYTNLKVEADHSPQGAILKAIAHMKVVRGRTEERITTKNENQLEQEGYTVTLARHRHALTRTYKSDAASTIAACFEGLAEGLNTRFKGELNEKGIVRDSRSFVLNLRESPTPMAQVISDFRSELVSRLKIERNEDQRHITTRILGEKWCISPDHKRRIQEGCETIQKKLVEF